MNATDTLLSDTNHRYSDSKFEGMCLDTGSQKSVTGIAQACAYCARYNIKFRTIPSSEMYRFTDKVHPSLGQMVLKLPLPTGKRIRIKIDVIAVSYTHLTLPTILLV